MVSRYDHLVSDVEGGLVDIHLIMSDEEPHPTLVHISMPEDPNRRKAAISIFNGGLSTYYLEDKCTVNQWRTDVQELKSGQWNATHRKVMDGPPSKRQRSPSLDDGYSELMKTLKTEMARPDRTALEDHIAHQQPQVHHQQVQQVSQPMQRQVHHQPVPQHASPVALPPVAHAHRSNSQPIHQPPPAHSVSQYQRGQTHVQPTLKEGDFISHPQLGRGRVVWNLQSRLVVMFQGSWTLEDLHPEWARYRT